MVHRFRTARSLRAVLGLALFVLPALALGAQVPDPPLPPPAPAPEPGPAPEPPLPPVPPGPPAGLFAVVELELTPGEEGCARVDPEEVTIFSRDRDPRGVEWRVLGKDPNHLWAMESAPEKGESTAEGLGPAFRIPCGVLSSVRTGIVNKPGVWIYRVAVYRCLPDGQLDPATEPFCVVDPVVVVREPPDGS